MNFKSSYIILAIVLSMTPVAVVYADQVPASVNAVEGDPFYFSEGDFGIGLLKYFDRPLTPYLVPGVTNENSSIREISEAYHTATEDLKKKIIVTDYNRGAIYSVTFSGGELRNPETFTSFLKFTHLEIDRGNPLVPKNQQYIDYGLELVSLPNKDNELFYKYLVAKYINEYYSAEAFDITVDVLTGDGYTLQKWIYSDCELFSYYTYLDENLANLKFVGEFVSEIREKSSFECDGFSVDFELSESEQISEGPLVLADFVPSKEQRATAYHIEFSGGELEQPEQFVFSKFVPVTDHDIWPIHVPGYTIGDKPQFTLESLPQLDQKKIL